ncbi:MAG: hypothetical protein KDD34_08140, partial [Bdellovibrionales bacterium]|nr:hypothetical protein [Bdellovibrionales bacterium]
KKLETAKTLVPAPEITLHKESKVGVLYYGSSQEALLEAFEELNSDRKTPLNICRVKALPFHKDVEEFLKVNDHIIIVEQNRDQQMKSILCMEFPEQACKISSIHQFDGLPLEAKYVESEFRKKALDL